MTFPRGQKPFAGCANGTQSEGEVMIGRLEKLAKRNLSDREITAIGKALPMMLSIPQTDERERTWVLLRAKRQARPVEIGLRDK
jgi:hypothetical protein